MIIPPENLNQFLSRISDNARQATGAEHSTFSVSIVIPSFNQGHFLEQTLMSVINQDYPGTELIIIDGGSTDNTLEVIKKYKKWIAYWVSEPDRGQSDALKKGFNRARGDIQGWMNSDDIYLPGAFTHIVDIFNKHPDIQVCYGNWCSIDGGNRVIDVHYALAPRMPHAPFENMDAYNQAMFWRRGVYDRCSGFDENLHQLMDNDIIIQFLKNEGISKFYKTDFFLGAFRRHQAQKTDATAMSILQQQEEKYLEQKYGFPRADSMSGKYYRFQYRCAQLFESTRYGGPAYTIKKFIQAYRRRGKFF